MHHDRPSGREPLVFAGLAAAASLALAGCHGSAAPAGAPGGKSGPVEVGFRVLTAAPVPLETELPGRVSALRTAEVRPQISGLIESRLFTEGALVRAGQPLFRIDPSLYRAATAQAEANLASARANAEAAAAKAERYRPLAEQEAVSRQDYTDALAAARAARAAIAQQSAAVQTARITMRFTTVPAPISGRIGRALATEGTLVTTGQASPLAVISVLDPVYVDLQQSAADLLRLRRSMASGGAAAMTTPVRLKLDDGSEYPLVGRLEFSEVTADPATGTVTLRARFANPQGLLLPGMFVRARLAQASAARAWLVPEAALVRDAKGNPQVWLVGPGNTAVLRPISTSGTLGSAWIVTGGLSDGERLITQGIGKLKPGAPIKPLAEAADLPGSGAGAAPPPGR